MCVPRASTLCQAIVLRYTIIILMIMMMIMVMMMIIMIIITIIIASTMITLNFHFYVCDHHDYHY